MLKISYFEKLCSIFLNNAAFAMAFIGIVFLENYFIIFFSFLFTLVILIFLLNVLHNKKFFYMDSTLQKYAEILNKKVTCISEEQIIAHKIMNQEIFLGKFTIKNEKISLLWIFFDIIPAYYIFLHLPQKLNYINIFSYNKTDNEVFIEIYTKDFILNDF